MRLLKYGEDGRLTITSFDDNAIPPYAILSHLWGEDAEEVTFADLAQGGGMHKHGYMKIRFCGEQAQQDGLQYFWVDACCIDKSDKAELSSAIQSMFRWYQNAAKCYVYLSDVSTKRRKASSFSTEFTWEPAFRSSRWFTRGWTLQDLLAPNSVEFFSREWERLGDKISLRLLIKKITGIPCEALDGAPLCRFSVEERLRWKGDRETKHEEDAWYSLAGIFDVEIAPAYSEGAASAFKRLKDEIEKLEICVRDIRYTDPRHEKKRIEDTKGGLLADSYRWVLDNITFQQWRQDPNSRLLWVKGDPGKGKTMLLCGIINELQSSMPQSTLLSYFFCQAIDARINSATAVLRGLLHMLVTQQPSLASHVRKKHDHAGKAMFEDANAWIVLVEIFEALFQDPSLRMTYLIIDALDECVTDLPKLLEFVAKQSSASSRVKWIVSSRNWPDIEAQLEQAGHKVNLSLELNAQSVAAAVDVFIQQKVDQLALEKQYKPEVRHAVLQHLRSNANDTFLWVALVCQDLKMTPKWNVLKKLALFPPGLDSLYKRMMDQINESEGAEVCRQVLASTAILYRPVALPELIALVEQLEDLDDLESVREIIGFCGSFLTLREDTIYFVHQSAKDFLFAKAYGEAFPAGSEAVHRTIFSRSLAILSRTLHRDMYSLEAPGYPIENVKLSEVDPLAVSRYPCIYWIDHLCDSKPDFLANRVGDLQVLGAVDEFLRKKYLYWLEGLSLCKSVGKGVVLIEKLWSLVQEMYDQKRLAQLIHDARRFVMYHKGAIEGYPLQTYISALLFSPTGSLIRQLFQHEEPEAIIVRPILSDGWSACLQTLEGHSRCVSSVAFSPDSTRLASASDDSTVKIWDASSGACLQTFEGHSRRVSSVAFSPDSTRLASASDDSTVKIWDASSGACLQTLEGHSRRVSSVVFSPDSTRLSSASDDSTVKIWDASSGACLQTLEGHSRRVSSVAFSPDSTRLASASDDSTVKIWDASSGAWLQTFEGHSRRVSSVAFSHDSTRLSSASDDSTVKIWDASSGAYLQTLEGHSDAVSSVAFSHDSTKLASASYDNTVKVWDAGSGECLQTLEGHGDAVRLVTFSHDLNWLASASWDRVVKIWDLKSGTCFQTLNVGTTLDRIAFDEFDSFLKTNIGVIEITVPPGYNLPPSVAEPPSPQDRSLALSADGIWITYDSHGLVWLPSEYRPSCSAVSGDRIGFGVGSGKVWSCSIQLDTTRRQQNEVEDTVQVLGMERTTRERLQVTSHTARPRLSEETIQEHPRQLGLQPLQTERSKPWSELDKDSTYGGTTFDGDESMFSGQTITHSSVSETGNEKPSGILFPEHTINDGDIRSIISDEDDDQSRISMSNAGRSREIENSIVSLLANNPILTPVYKDALELMPKERFTNNFGRVLRAFRVDLRRLDGTLITQELSAVLLSKEVRKRIARKITDRFVSDQNPLSEQDLRRVHGPDETNFSYLEAWLTKTNVRPSLLKDAPGQPDGDMHEGGILSEEATIVVQPDYEENGSDMSNSEEEGKEYSRNMDVARFPRLDLVMQEIIEGQPFQNMVTRLKEFLLPAGLLRDILPVPRENITYESNGSHGLLSTIQARLEDLTELEWDWWPLPPRMGPLNEGDTRVFWRCLCGTVRWRTLKSAQKHILEDILKEPPGVSQRPLFCASLFSSTVQTNPPLRPALALGNQPRSGSLPFSRSTASAAVPSLPTNSDPISRFSDSTASSQISRETSPIPGHTASTQNGYQQKKPLWFIFKIEGSRSSLDWDHFGDEGLATDRLFQQKLKQRHNELRGWFRLWFSYWRLSYWEFVKLQRTRPGRLVDRGVDLPETLDYEYSPRPPRITAEDPWISRHEFEEIVKSCITPCWLNRLPTFLGFHDCACPNADAKRLISALPKRNTKFMISSSSDGEDYVWGIHARYVVSGLYVLWIHMAILAITLSLWIWWQTKHPDDLQGASVPLTVAGICISTFWASTGILKGLR